LNTSSGDSPVSDSRPVTAATALSPPLKLGAPRYGENVQAERYSPSIRPGARYTSGLVSVVKVPQLFRNTTSTSTAVRTATVAPWALGRAKGRTMVAPY
jgi:hypothetical protein